jgi:hypothetical protein
MMCPEWALVGTVTISPALVWRRREAGETLLMRAPADLGKPTTMFGFSPGPASSSVPWVETWWGLPLHLLTGTQLTVVIRTLVTCAEGVLLVVVVLTLGVVAAGGALPPADVPPGLAASDGCEAMRASSSASAEAVRNLKRL